MSDKDSGYWDQAVREIRAGGRERFRDIVLEFQDSLRFTVGYHLRGDDERVEEILHCAFIRAFRNLESFELGQPLGPWLKAIARNEALNEVRRVRRAAGLAREVLHAELLKAREESDPPEELVERLRSCLGKLQESAREVVRLRYFQKLAFEEVARALGRSSGAIRVGLLQIRRSLRVCIERSQA